ncbi:MAG: glutamine--fructose-6-phosphate transaminase (isomerizing), partial [Patescibacteria group bacterium]
MCGIFVQYDSQLSPSTLIQGLQKLEYRGYDSSGIAMLEFGKIVTTKSSGKVAILEEKSNNFYKGNLGVIGIGHTRWATHGDPNEINAHPHFTQSQNFAIVHNGIIDNFRELKTKLEQKGIHFSSQTDTEIIVNLIETYYNGDLLEAVKKTISDLSGAYSFAVITTKEPDRIVAVRNGCSLMLGVGDEKYVLSSDISAILDSTRKIIFLEDQSLVDIGQKKYQIFDFEANILNPEITTIEWDTEQASKSGYEHYLLKEIMEQPDSISSTLRNRVNFENQKIALNGLEEVRDRLKNIKNVLILGIGTSYYSSKLGELYFEEICGIPCKVEMSPEFRLKSSAITKDTWVIAVSQSGETYDTINAIQIAKSKGALI